MSVSPLALFGLDGTLANSHADVIAADMQAVEKGIAQVLEVATG